MSVDYEPSDFDILLAEGVTSSNGLSSLDFSFPLSESNDDINAADQHDSLLRLVPGVCTVVAFVRNLFVCVLGMDICVLCAYVPIFLWAYAYN